MDVFGCDADNTMFATSWQAVYNRLVTVDRASSRITPQTPHGGLPLPANSVTDSSCDPLEGVVCPRCGYDLRGIAAAWKEVCPLNGTCAECGLEFGWDVVMRPDRSAPRWCIEFMARPSSLLRYHQFFSAAMKTWLRSLWPWLFWNRLNMALRVRWVRIAVYLLLLLTPLLFGWAGMRVGMAAWARWKWQTAIDAQMQTLPAQIATMQALLPTVALPSGQWPVFPPTLGIVEVTTKTHGVQARIAWAQQLKVTPLTIRHSYSAAIIEAVFTPWAEQSSGAIEFPGFNYGGKVFEVVSEPYPTSPSLLLAHTFEKPWSAASSGGGLVSGRFPSFLNDMEMAAGAIAIGSVLLVIFPMSLVLLPVTRKRAKVRWSHIGRVAAYSASIPIATVTGLSFAWVAVVLIGEGDRNLKGMMLIAALLGMLGFGACWWWAAIRNYLKLPHALAVTMLLGLLCAMLSIMVMAMISVLMGV